MEPLWMCRVCMAEDGRMHPIAYTHLQSTYESLTSKPLETEDQRPTFVCYICYARLENSYQLRKACLLSESLFTKILSSYNPLFLPNVSGIGERLEIVHPVIQLSLSGGAPADDAVAKNSLPENVEVILLDELAVCRDHTSLVDTGVLIDFRINQGINAHKKRRQHAQKTNKTLNDEQTSTAAQQLGTNSCIPIDNEQIVAKPLETSSNVLIDNEEIVAKSFEINSNILIDNEHIADKSLETSSNNIVVEDKSDVKNNINCGKDNGDVKLNNQRKIKKTVRFNIEDNKLGKSTPARKFATNSNILMKSKQNTTAVKRLEVPLNTLTGTDRMVANESETNSNTLSNNKFEINSNTLLHDEQIVAKQRKLRAQKTPNTYINFEQNPTAAKRLERNSNTLIDNEQSVAKQLDSNSKNSKIKKTVRFNIEENHSSKNTSGKRFITNSNTLIGGDQTTTAAKPLEVNLKTFISTEHIAVNEFADDSKKFTKNVFETTPTTLLDNEQIVAKQRRLRSQRTPNTFTDKEQTPTAAKHLERNSNTVIDNDQIVTKQFDTNSNNSKIKKAVRVNIGENQLGKSTSAKRYVIDSNTLIDGEQTTTAAKQLEVNLNTFKDTEQIAVNEFASDSKKLSKNIFETNSIILLDDEQTVAKQRRLRSQRTPNTFTDKEQTPTTAKNLERISNTVIDNEQIVTKQLETNSNKSKTKKTVSFNIEEKLDKNTSAKKIATNLKRIIGGEQTTTAPTPPEVNSNTLIDTEHIDNNKFETNSNTLADDKQVTDNANEKNTKIFIDSEDTPTAAKQLEVNLNTVTENEQIAAKQFEKNSNALINSDLVADKPLETNSNQSKIKKTVTINIEHNEGIAAQQLETNSITLIDDEKNAAKQLEATSNILIDNEQTPASVEQLDTNSNNNTVEEIVYQCKVCNKYCTYPSDLRNHVRIHTGEKPYQCDVCDTCFNTKCNLKRHILSVHMGMKFPKKRRRKVKKRKHRNASTCIDTEQMPIAAGQLAKNSSNNEEKSDSQNKIIEKRSKGNGNVQLTNKKAPRKKPIVHLLKGVTKNQCQVCKKRFHNSSNLRRHLRIHSDEKPYQCDVCKKFFRSSSSLNCHILIHKDVKAYQCSVCKNSFRYLCNLKSHVREKHSDEKPYQCDICKKYFTRSALYSHLRTHTGERPFQCSICKKSFNHKSHLKTHMRKHTGEKPYQCHICKKYFSKNNNLKAHIRLRICKKPD